MKTFWLTWLKILNILHTIPLYLILVVFCLSDSCQLKQCNFHKKHFEVFGLFNLRSIFILNMLKAWETKLKPCAYGFAHIKSWRDKSWLQWRWEKDNIYFNHHFYLDVLHWQILHISDLKPIVPPIWKCLNKESFWIAWFLEFWL